MDNLISFLNSRSEISREELLSALCREIDPVSRDALAGGSRALVVSEYNRRTLLRMLENERAGGTGIAPENTSPAETGSALALVFSLRDFLKKYMGDRPEGHLWIILSCLFLSFIAEEPMHPQDIVHWEEGNGEFFCPAREEEEGSLCRWCVCRTLREFHK